MEEIETANENLINLNMELEKANKRYLVDMDMARNVQTAFLPPKPPVSEQLDIALLYQPMAGVSGDFYDFFQNEEKIEGVGLFDVSGHGISSGLITLLAKSIIFRNFQQMKEHKLSLTMASINNSLIEEIEQSGFYLTGILLRFKDDSIEYVNASHPPVIFKSGKTGLAAPVTSPDKSELSGLMLGVSMMQEKYSNINVKFRPGDTIILYTDSLYETRDQSEKEFDIAGITNSMKNAPDASAQEILDHIMNDFYNFAGRKDNFNDDMTVIVIKKKQA